MSRSDRRPNQTHKLRRFPIQLSRAGEARQDQHGKTLNLPGQPKATRRHNRYNQKPHPTGSELKINCNQKSLEPNRGHQFSMAGCSAQASLQSDSMKRSGTSVENIIPS
tara:strand:- start:39397 stop:39723 length:327 start_codon:yes stop_codon:yes gene_type:complete